MSYSCMYTSWLCHMKSLTKVVPSYQVPGLQTTAPLEHTENTFFHFTFTQMHIFCTIWCKYLCKLTQICVIYTNLGRQEALVDHRHKTQITFTHFLTPKVDPPPPQLVRCLQFMLDVSRLQIHHCGNRVPSWNHQLSPPHRTWSGRAATPARTWSCWG